MGYTSEEYDKIKRELEKQLEDEPIYRGCANAQCFCTGACRQIIGYRKKLKNPFEVRIDFKEK